MQTLLSSEEGSPSLPLWLVGEASLASLLQTLPPAQSAWVRSSGYSAERHKLLLLPGGEGQLAGALWGLGGTRDLNELSLWDAASLPDRLPAGTYRIATELPEG